MGTIRRIVKDHPASDLLVASGLAIAGTSASDWGLAASDHDQRVVLYGAVLAAATTLLGLVSASLAIIKGVGDGPRITAVRRQIGARLTEQMGASMKGLGVTSALATVALLADTEKAAPQWVIATVYFAIVFGACRLARSVWMTMLVLRLDDADATGTPPTRQIKRRDRVA